MHCPRKCQSGKRQPAALLPHAATTFLSFDDCVLVAANAITSRVELALRGIPVSDSQPRRRILRTGRHHHITVETPPHGWKNEDVLNDQLLPLDLSKVQELKLLHHGKGTLRPLGAHPTDFSRDRIPLILVHGLNGGPKNMQPFVDHFRSGKYQLYVFCYNDADRLTSLNGFDLAWQLRCLPFYMSGKLIGIIGHSMGGIVIRQALNDLVLARDGGIHNFGVGFIAVDTPWHGYSGPEDGFFMSLARPFMDDGLEDMRAASGMFLGEPHNPRLTAREPLLKVKLPKSVRIDLCFATEGSTVEDYTEGDLSDLAQRLVVFLQNQGPMTGSQQMMHFFDALTSSRAYAGFWAELQPLIQKQLLTPEAVLAGLNRYYPRFRGDHMTVLKNRRMLRCIAQWLDPFSRQ